MIKEHRSEVGFAEESPRKVFGRLGVSFASREELAATLPFSLDDVTA